MSWTGFLLAYLLGGITFIPLAVAVVIAHAYYTFPHRPDVLDPASTTTASEPAASASRSRSHSHDDLVQPGDDLSGLGAAQARPDAGADSLAPTDKDQQAQSKPWNNHELDVASGYFAVCREYTPMGINAKPIERSTPVGSTTVAAPSQSVYQAMYRTIFERKQTPGPLDEKSNVSQRPKKAGNVFYVVLRHGHLMLFDDEEQLEVRHVVSLAHHDVSIYSGGDTTPEGELWIKRSALCLSRKKDVTDKAADSQTSKPFYLFSENCSAKEDFYFALLRNQDLTFGGDNKAPAPLGFDVKDILSLVQRLHSTEEHMHTRWLNAMIGRVFLSINRTADFENFIREKLTTKISRVKRPTFLSDISIRDIDPGDSAPWIMNPRLRDLNVEGECVVEADVRYTGNFRIEVATTARIDLGARFKVREVDLVLAVVLRKIEGHMLFKVKPPPSNRIWQTFQSMPKIEMTIEPIVSARQITYTVILRQIENRIKEVIAETMVLPFWDDTPFFRTEHKRWRGGIFEGDDAVVKESLATSTEYIPPSSSLTAAAVERIQDGDKGEQKEEEEEEVQPGSGDIRQVEKSHSLPNLEASQLGGLFSRKGNKNGSTKFGGNGSSTSLDTTTPEIHVPPPLQSPRPAHTAEPAKPVVVMANASDSGSSSDLDQFPEALKPVASSSDNGNRSRASFSRASFSSAASNSGRHNSLSAPSRPPPVAHSSSHSSTSSQNEDAHDENEAASSLAPASMRRRNTASSSESADKPSSSRPPPLSPSGSNAPSVRSQTESIGSNPFSRRESLGSTSTGDAPNQGIAKRTTLAAVTNAAAQATAQARQWGWNAIQRRKEQQAAKKASTNGHNRGSSVDLSQPMGGGRPFPPPGTPLPGPETPPTKIAPSTSNSNLHSNYVSSSNSAPRPSLPPRPSEADRDNNHHHHHHHHHHADSSRNRGGAEHPEPPSSLPRQRLASLAHERGNSEESLMVVAAPEESEPSTPVSESIFEEEEVPDTPQITQQTTQNVSQPPKNEESHGSTGSESDDDEASKHATTPPLLASNEHGARKVERSIGSGDGGYPKWVES